MRVDRHRASAENVRPEGQGARGDLALASSFASAMRRYQRADRPAQNETRRSDEQASRHQSRASTRNQAPLPEQALEMSGEGVGEFILTLPAAFSPLAADASTEGAAMPREVRRRRAALDEETSHCIEIEHAGSGLRCVLSLQDGVWLLAVQHGPDVSDENASELIKTLSERFAALGLGPIDIIS